MLQAFLSRSLAAKLLWVFVPLVCIAQISVFALQAWSFYQEEKQELLERLNELAEVQSSALASPMWEFDSDQIENNIIQLEKLHYFSSIVVFDDSQNQMAALGDVSATPQLKDYRIVKKVLHKDADQMIEVGSIVLTVHGNHIFADLIENVKYNSIILAVVIIALVGGVFATTRMFISTPLTRLENAINKMDGEPVGWQSNDELGTVVKAYNEMQDRRQEAEAEVKQYQNHLEVLVEDRTADLQRALATITSSIKYARRIQRSMLPEAGMLSALFDDHFLIWDPLEPVGGDMIWSHPWGEGNILLIGDCTGHGVPGAFMTLISASALERALLDVPEGNLLALGQTMHQLIKRMLNQHADGKSSDDGMEMGLCYLPKDKKTLHFLGARFNLYIINRSGDLREIRGTKSGVGYPNIPDDQDFVVHELEAAKGENYYLSSDGLTDQIGGKRRCMFGKRRLKALLQKNAGHPFEIQKQALLSDFEAYMGDENRRDDLSVFGFQITKGENMLAKESISFRDQLDRHGVIFCYNGIITEEILTGIAKALKSKLAGTVPRGHSRKIFSLFVEQVQNVIRYSAEYETHQVKDKVTELRYGQFMVGEKDGKYFVTCCNMMSVNDAPRLQTKLELIRDMSRDEIKKAYKEVLKGKTPEGSKGAGVGFLEIARHASEGIEFDFKKINNDYVFFYIKAFL